MAPKNTCQTQLYPCLNELASGGAKKTQDYFGESCKYLLCRLFSCDKQAFNCICRVTHTDSSFGASYLLYIPTMWNKIDNTHTALLRIKESRTIVPPVH